MLSLDEIKTSNYIETEGTYKLKIEKVEFSTTDNGNDCHNFDCVNEDGLHIGVSFYFTEKALWRYKKFIQALGLAATGTVDEKQLSNSLVGKEFIGIVRRKKPRQNIVTGEYEESKYFEVVDFAKC